ncbi:ribonuclease HII, partial [Candidatus Woesearchaeota archaeon]|nr:ribonuclease HII [Candidatus Woesearchaeota archaeon]
KIIVGLDEAGRGPVLGPLVMAALAVKEENIKKLEWMGVKDSKKLSAQVREELFEQIREVVEDFRIEMIEPDAIDLSVNGEESNLNWLEADTSARMISELDPDTIIVDCPSPNIKAYKEYFASRLSKAVRDKAELIVEHKADVNYIVASAASVVAKVIRDRHIEHLKTEIGVDFGSGYMSDPKTQEFLKNYYKTHPHMFRRSWQSYKNVEDAQKQKKLGEF